MRPNTLRLLALCAGAAPAVAQPQAERDVVSLYQSSCSSCHGAKMEGGQGPSLTAGRWKHGDDLGSLERSIRNGYPERGMPAFASLGDSATKALAIYIRETATRANDPQPREEQVLPSGVQHSEVQSYRFETVADGLDVPWSIAFLPDGRMLVTERVGRLRIVDHGRLDPRPIAGVPPVVVQDEAGLMSVVADPDFAHNGWIYLSLSDPAPDGAAMTKIVRAKLQDMRLVDPQAIFAIPRDRYQKGYVLFGGRMVFQGPYLFFSVGERGMTPDIVGNAQDLSLPNGKVHRVFHDGSVPTDNPFAGRPGAFRSIWSYGNRNPQGLAVNPADGALWESEHGPRGGDKLNRIERGVDYGWPVITYGMNYDATPIWWIDRGTGAKVYAKTSAPGMRQPVINWTPSIAVSEIEFYRGDRLPNWKGDLFIGSLAQQKFLRVTIRGGTAVHTEELFHGLGRVRDIKTGPDGLLYLALEYIGKLGRVVRIVPTE